jgi:hypothetical protein
MKRKRANFSLVSFGFSFEKPEVEELEVDIYVNEEFSAANNDEFLDKKFFSSN